MTKRFLAATAIALSLSSCAYLDEILSGTQTGKPGKGTDTTSVNIKDSLITKDTAIVKEKDTVSIPNLSDTLLIRGNEKVRETMIAFSMDGQSPYFQREALNYGNFEWMSVGYYDAWTHFRSLIGFNLSEKEMKGIKKATLELTTRDWTYKHLHGPVTIELYPMYSSWSEGNGGTGNDSYNTAKYLGPTNSIDVNGATAMESEFGKPWKRQFVGIGLDCMPKPIATATHSASEGSNVVWSFDITGAATLEQLSKGFLIVLKDRTNTTDNQYFDYPNIYTTENSVGESVAPRLVIVK